LASRGFAVRVRTAHSAPDDRRSAACCAVHRRLEISNSALSAARRKSLRRLASDIISDITALLPFIEQNISPDDLGTLVDLGQRLQLTAYDAAYVALALPWGIALATEDKAMLAATRTLKIKTLN